MIEQLLAKFDQSLLRYEQFQERIIAHLEREGLKMEHRLEKKTAESKAEMEKRTAENKAEMEKRTAENKAEMEKTIADTKIYIEKVLGRNTTKIITIFSSMMGLLIAAMTFLHLYL